MRKSWETFAQQNFHEPSNEEWYKATCEMLDESYLNSPMGRTFSFELMGRLNDLGISRNIIRQGKPVGTGKVNRDTLSSLEAEIEETIADPETVERIVENVIFLDAIEDALQVLSKEQRQAITLYFGLGQEDRMSQNEIATQMGVSPKAVTDYLSSGIRNIRRNKWSVRTLSDFLR